MRIGVNSGKEATRLLSMDVIWLQFKMGYSRKLETWPERWLFQYLDFFFFSNCCLIFIWNPLVTISSFPHSVRFCVYFSASSSLSSKVYLWWFNILESFTYYFLITKNSLVSLFYITFIRDLLWPYDISHGSSVFTPKRENH